MYHSPDTCPRGGPEPEAPARPGRPPAAPTPARPESRPAQRGPGQPVLAEGSRRPRPRPDRPHGGRAALRLPAPGRPVGLHPRPDPARRLADLPAGRPGQAALGMRCLLTRTGPGAATTFESGAFLRTRDDAGFPNMQYEFPPLTRQLCGGRLVPVPGFQFWMDLSRPQSRGTVMLRSADPACQPSIVFSHLGGRQDIRDLAAVIRLARELVRQHAWQAYRREELSPGPDLTTDAELETYLRRRTGTSRPAPATRRRGDRGPGQGGARTAGHRRVRHAESGHGQPQRASCHDGGEDLRPEPRRSALPPADVPYHRAGAPSPAHPSRLLT